MKHVKKILSILLVAALLFTYASAALALEIDLGGTVTTGGLNDLNVRQAARDYMDTRAAYLLGETETMEWIVTGIADDEAAHLEMYREAGISVNESVYDIVEVECYDNEAYATVKEMVSYAINGVAGWEQVEHKMIVISSDNDAFVVSD